MKGDPFEEKFFLKKVSQCRKTERGDPLMFFNIHSVAKHEKMQGDPLGKKISEKKTSRSAEKIERGDSLVWPGMVLRGKTGKTFLVQFAKPNGAI